MSKLIPPAKRVEQARMLIQQARDLPVPDDLGWENFTYVAKVKDLLRQAIELVKLIPYSPSASVELKAEVQDLVNEMGQAEKEILHKELLN